MRRILSLAIFGAAFWLAQPGFGQPGGDRSNRSGADDTKKGEDTKKIEADLARLKEQVRELEAKLAKAKEPPKADAPATGRNGGSTGRTQPQGPPTTDRRPIPPAAEEGNRDRGQSRPGPGGPGGFGRGPGGFGPDRGPRGPGGFGPPGDRPGRGGPPVGGMGRGGDRTGREPSAADSAAALTRRIDVVIGELEQLKKEVERLKK